VASEPTAAHEPSADATLALLQRWHGGDPEALRELLRQHLPWIRERVHQRLGPALRRRGDTEDFLHEAVIELLRYTPRFLVGESDAFRRLLSRIVENMMRDQHEFFARQRRALAREDARLDDSVLCLDARARTATSPSQAAARSEERAWLRLALELLAPEDRDAIVLREYEQLPFAEVGARLGVAADAARMRFQRALARLAAAVEKLRRGEF
jgi:RNA polymerase sigma-70 factor (ECF subfamily)